MSGSTGPGPAPGSGAGPYSGFGGVGASAYPASFGSTPASPLTPYVSSAFNVWKRGGGPGQASFQDVHDRVLRQDPTALTALGALWASARDRLDEAAAAVRGSSDRLADRWVSPGATGFLADGPGQILAFLDRWSAAAQSNVDQTTRLHAQVVTAQTRLRQLAAHRQQDTSFKAVVERMVADPAVVARVATVLPIKVLLAAANPWLLPTAVKHEYDQTKTRVEEEYQHQGQLVESGLGLRYQEAAQVLARDGVGPRYNPPLVASTGPEVIVIDPPPPMALGTVPAGVPRGGVTEAVPGPGSPEGTPGLLRVRPLLAAPAERATAGPALTRPGPAGPSLGERAPTGERPYGADGGRTGGGGGPDGVLNPRRPTGPAGGADPTITGSGAGAGSGTGADAGRNGAGRNGADPGSAAGEEATGNGQGSAQAEGGRPAEGSVHFGARPGGSLGGSGGGGTQARLSRDRGRRAGGSRAAGRRSVPASEPTDPPPGTIGPGRPIAAELPGGPGAGPPRPGDRRGAAALADLAAFGVVGAPRGTAGTRPGTVADAAGTDSIVPEVDVLRPNAQRDDRSGVRSAGADALNPASDEAPGPVGSRGRAAFDPAAETSAMEVNPPASRQGRRRRRASPTDETR
jgi:hypothetical protein